MKFIQHALAAFSTLLILCFTAFCVTDKGSEASQRRPSKPVEEQNVVPDKALVKKSGLTKKGASTVVTKGTTDNKAAGARTASTTAKFVAGSVSTKNERSAVERSSTPFKAEQHLISDHLPRGYVRNGTVDYTGIIQEVINKFDNVVFPPFPILINDSGLNVESNKSLYFEKGSVLRLKPSAKKSYNIINIRGASNVSIYNPVIIGDRYSHLGSDGEFGMGIAIRGGKNIKIFSPKISECWGDGIYIGQDRNEKVPKDIYIGKAYLKKNRRDGISIISVNGLVLEDVYAGFQDGTKPMCGINFETNNPDCEIKNVKVLNPKTEFNTGSGIQVGISTLLGKGLKNVNMEIINHHDVNSGSFAFKIACNKKEASLSGGVSGTIRVTNPSWNGTKGNRPLAFITNQADLKLEVINPRIKNSSGNMLSDNQMNEILKKHSNGRLLIEHK